MRNCGDGRDRHSIALHFKRPLLSPTVPWAPGTVKGAAARGTLDFRVVEHHQYRIFQPGGVWEAISEEGGRNVRNLACRVVIDPVSPTPTPKHLNSNLNLSPRKIPEESPQPRKPLDFGLSASTRFCRCITRVQHRVSVPDLKRSRLFQFCFHIMFRYNQNFWTNPSKVLRMSAIAGLGARVVWRVDLKFRGAGTKYKVLRELRSG